MVAYYDEGDFEALAEQELALAASAVDRNDKTRQLNNAARYATQHEKSRAPHQPLPSSE